MVCKECQQPLRVIKGGMQSEEGSTVIKTINIFGCMNKDCDMAMKEQDRTVTENNSFTE